MPQGIWNSEWLSQNRQRRYPLAQDATAADLTGTVTLPDDFIVDLTWATHMTDDTDPSKYHLQSVSIFPDFYLLVFAYDDEAAVTIAIDAGTHAPNTSYAATGIGDFADNTVQITIGDLDNVSQLPAGRWEFALAAGRVEPSVIRPYVRGVTSLILRTGPTGADQSEPLQGDIELAAGTNMRMTVSTVDGRQRVRLDAINGEGLNEACDCAGTVIGAPIRTINGIPPDNAGNFTFIPDDCIDFEPIDGGLRVKEQCATPCCGCEELQTVTQALQDLEVRMSGLQAMASQLSSAVQQLTTSVLATKLGTEGPCA